MVYTNRRAAMKWCCPHTKRLKYFSSAKFDEHNNKFGKGWSPGSELMLGTNTSTLPILKLTSQIIPLSKMIYLKALLTFHQEALPLASPHNTAKITTCHTYLNQKITAHGIMHFQLETGIMFGSSSLLKKSQHQHTNF